MNPLLAFLWLAAIAPFTERGQTDFDTFLDVLSPYGTWTETEPAKYVYHPYEAGTPFSRGRWAYTDFGWTWIGDQDGSFASDHYGVWVLDDQNVWAWKPGPVWHPAPVDFRQTKEMIGWRPSKQDVLHQLTEKDDERFARPEEWIWVKKEKFGGPITPADVVAGAAAKAKGLLDDSSPATHVFKAWRDIDRPGPDPAGILPPARIVDDSMRHENQPSVVSETLLVVDPAWQPHPAPKPLEIYLYRPDILQDADGIQRRVHKWYHPGTAAEQKAQVDKMIQQIKQ